MQARPQARRHGWQRARHEAPPEPQYEEPEPDYQPSPVHPLHRYAAQPAAEPEQDYHEPQHHEPQQYADEQPADPSRYDDALYGQLESGAAGICARSGLSG